MITKNQLTEKLLKSKELKKSFNISKKYDNGLTLQKHAESYADSFLKLIKIIDKSKTVYGIVTHVSSSGMSRNARFYISDKAGITCINHLIRLCLDYSSAKNGYDLKLTGCGMDMIFNTVYNLSYFIYNEGYKLSKRDL